MKVHSVTVPCILQININTGSLNKAIKVATDVAERYCDLANEMVQISEKNVDISGLGSLPVKADDVTVEEA